MLTLRAFGTLDVRDGAGRPVESLLAQPKRSALLVYLVLARPRGLHRRDALLARFWPELDQGHGRHALSQALTFLRQHLGEGFVITRGDEEVGVDHEQVSCDVIALEQALTTGDWATALEIYQDDLLNGFHVDGAQPFEDWLDRRRERLRERAADAAWQAALDLVEDGQLVEAGWAAEDALELTSTDESRVREFVEAMTRAGDRSTALRVFSKFESVLARVLDVPPAPETLELVDAIRRGEIGSASGPRGTE